MYNVSVFASLFLIPLLLNCAFWTNKTQPLAANNPNSKLLVAAILGTAVVVLK